MTNTPDTLIVTGPAFQQIPLDNALVTPTGGIQQTLAQALSITDGVVSVIEFGAVGDGVTDDTAAIQAAINAAQGGGPLQPQGRGARRLYFPGGKTFLVTGLTVTHSIELFGDGEQASFIQLKTGSSSPIFTIACVYDQFDNYQLGNPPPTIAFTYLHLVAPSNSDPSGLNVGHGIALRTASVKPSYVKVVIDRCQFDHLPGNGIDGNGFGANGFVIITDCYFVACQNNIGATSNYDWRVIACDFNGAVVDNILLSGCGGFDFYGCNSYSARQYDLHVFSSSGAGLGLHKWFGGSLDGGAGNRLFYDNRNTTGSPFMFIGANFAPGSLTNVTSDIYVTSNANNDLTLIGCMFTAPNAGAYNVQFQTAGVNTVSANNLWINTTAALAFSQPNQILGSYYSSSVEAAQYQISSPIVVNSGIQYSGIYVNNGSHIIAALQGFNTNNDSGAMLLYNTGTLQAAISASSLQPNFINGDVYIGNGSTNAAPAGHAVRAPSGSGSNIAGAPLTLIGGLGTGTGVGGDIIVQSSQAGSTGSALNSATEVFRAKATGGISINAGPSWTSGTGAPASTTTRGSMYSRTDGGVGTTLYVSQGGGTWNPVAGV